MPHLDYGDIFYEQPQNYTPCTMIESAQYNAVLSIIGAVEGLSLERFIRKFAFRVSRLYTLMPKTSSFL